MNKYLPGLISTQIINTWNAIEWEHAEILMKQNSENVI